MIPPWRSSLERALPGKILGPGAPAYDEARGLFNAAIDRRPGAIVVATSAADVAAAVAVAAGEGLPVALRGGGHGVAGHALCDGGVCVDLRGLRDLAVDAAAGTVTVGAGCTWGDVLERLEPAGAGTPGGFDVRVGVAGLTLGGGYGALSRLCGLACDNLVAAEIVDAEGRRGAASDELLWALRGAGSSFAAVTSFTLRVHPLRPVVAGAVAVPLRHAAAWLRWYREWQATLADEDTAYFGINVERDGSGYAMIAWISFSGDGAALAALRASGPLLHDDIAPTSYRALHVANVTTFPEGHQHHWRARFVRALDDEVVAALLEHARRARGMWMVVEQLGGAIARVAADATAFPHRAAPFGVVTAINWPAGERAPDETLAVAGSLHAALAPAAVGTYANYLMSDDAEAAYGANLPRLRALKRRVDPGNRFRGVVDLGRG